MIAWWAILLIVLAILLLMMLLIVLVAVIATRYTFYLAYLHTFVRPPGTRTGLNVLPQMFSFFFFATRSPRSLDRSP